MCLMRYTHASSIIPRMNRYPGVRAEIPMIITHGAWLFWKAMYKKSGFPTVSVVMPCCEISRSNSVAYISGESAVMSELK